MAYSTDLKKLCLRNLSDNHLENDCRALKSKCETFGDIVKFHIFRGDPNKKPLVFIEFTNTEDAANAMRRLQDMSIEADYGRRKNDQNNNSNKGPSDNSGESFGFSKFKNSSQGESFSFSSVDKKESNIADRLIFNKNKSLNGFNSVTKFDNEKVLENGFGSDCEAKTNAQESNLSKKAKDILEDIIFHSQLDSYEIKITKKSNTRECSTCKKRAELDCKECKFSYCSLECHHASILKLALELSIKNDQKNSDTKISSSNQICGTENVLPSIEEIPIEKPKLDCNLWKSYFQIDGFRSIEAVFEVVVKYVDEEASILWINLKKNEEQFQKFSDELNNFYGIITNQDKIDASQVKIGDIYIADNEGKFVRVVVNEISKWMRGNVKVRFIDFGEETLIKANNLLIPKEEFMARNSWATCIKFEKTIDLSNLNTNDILKVKFISQTETLNGTENGVTYDLVELVAGENGEKTSVKQDINIIDDNKFYDFDCLNQINLPTGENVKIMLLDDSALKKGFVTVAEYTKRSSDVISKLMTEVTLYCKTIANSDYKGYCPKANELCLALYDADQIWYRAECLTADNEKKVYKVFYLDFGNLDSVPMKNIVRINQELINIECYAQTAQIENFANLSIEESKKIEEFRVSKKLVATRVTKLDDIYYSIKI